MNLRLSKEKSDGFPAYSGDEKGTAQSKSIASLANVRALFA